MGTLFLYLATHSHSLSICSASGKYYKWFTLGSDSMHGNISAHSKCNWQVNRAFVELAYRKALAILCCVLDIFWAIFIVNFFLLLHIDTNKLLIHPKNFFLFFFKSPFGLHSEYGPKQNACAEYGNLYSFHYLSAE